ncbi:hypothetical protein SAMN04488245_114116 [Alloyangia pacifica]|uniref:Uncharacterized protein n=1 Tax=Alloyangia pacifica TaxID=311180 RepID=A0A1I6V0E6_9RHOB|nr:hypothetical protein SAMN04488245_114116 [Alloyangia pacifica]SFT07027.1 hypothetical protein SAMN04488050_109165 [Alloyangia pacifica]
MGTGARPWLGAGIFQAVLAPGARDGITVFTVGPFQQCRRGSMDSERSSVLLIH